MLTKEKTVFHMMRERNLLVRHHLTLSPSQHKTKERREPTVGVQLSSGMQAWSEQIPCACLRDADVLGLEGGHFEKERTSDWNTDEAGAWPQNN